MILYRLSCFLSWMFFKFFFHFRVSGGENVWKVKGAILAANHASFLDPPMAAVASPRPIHFLARKTLFRNNIFGRYIRSVRAVPFNRDAADSATLKNIIRLLRAGEMVLIFPEGTRTRDGKLQKGLAGIGFIALKAKVPVIPMYIKGSYDILSRGTKFFQLSKAEVCIGEPIYLNQWSESREVHTTKADYQRVADLIMDRIAALA